MRRGVAVALGAVVATALTVLAPAGSAGAAVGAAVEGAVEGRVGSRPAAAAVVPTGAAVYRAVAPRRVFDSREAPRRRAVAADERVVVQVTDPAADPAPTVATAAVVNLTAVGAGGPGWVTAWAAGSPRPWVSSLNLESGTDAVANLAIVPLDAQGRFALAPSVATHLVADLVGVFVPSGAPSTAGRTTAVPATRVLDTRGGPGPRGRVSRGGVVTADVARAGVPPGARAVVATVTLTEATGPGFVTVWGGSSARPWVSTLNARGAGATVANLAVVALDGGSTIRLFSEGGGHLVVDVVAYVTGDDAAPSTDGLFVAMPPSRRFDSRERSRWWLAGGVRRDLVAAAPAGLAANAVGMVAANVTVVDASGPLWVTAYPARTQPPSTSNVNADRAGATVAGFALVGLGRGAALSVRPSARTHLVVDQVGVFLGEARAPAPEAAPSGLGERGSDPIPAFDRPIEEFLRARGYPGASVAVAVDGRLVYVRTYGVADPARGEPVRVDSHFRIASQSKLLTATAVVRLAELGTLDLDQRVWPFLDGRVPRGVGADPRLRDVTIRQLLGHTSGFPANPDPFFSDSQPVVDAFGAPGPASCEQAARWVVGAPLVAAPGTRYAYANVNYCLAGLVIEAATGQPWADVVGDLVLRPAGVADMYLGRTYERLALDVVHATPGPYDAGGGTFMESIGAAGAWMGTPADVVRVVSRLDPAAPGPDLVSAGSFTEMRRRSPTDPDDPSIWYGLGVIEFDGGRAFGHSGALQGARSLTVSQSDGITWGIAVNARFDNHREVLWDLMRGAIGAVGAWPAYDLGPDLP
jgi:D-alanyl-D-alanine carboxypeptidase